MVALLLAAEPLPVVFERAVTALARGDYAAAEQGFDRVLQAAPKHVGALGNLGVVYSRTDRAAKAAEVYQRALGLAPKDPGLTLNLGLAYFKLEEHAKALPLFAALAAADPANTQVRELLATCRLFTGQVEAAVRLLESLPRTPGVLYLLGIGYARVKQPEKSRAALSELLENAASPAQADFLLGKAYYDGERFEEAASHFQKALELGFAPAHLELGKTYVSLRRSAEAEQELRQALPDPEAHHFLGGLLVQEGRAAEALPHLERARELRPDSWSVHYYLGRAKLEQGQALEAASLLRRAAELNPEEASVYYQLSRAWKAVGREAEARQALQRFTKLRAAQRQREMNRN